MRTQLSICSNVILGRVRFTGAFCVAMRRAPVDNRGAGAALRGCACDRSAADDGRTAERMPAAGEGGRRGARHLLGDLDAKRAPSPRQLTHVWGKGALRALGRHLLSARRVRPLVSRAACLSRIPPYGVNQMLLAAPALRTAR